MVQKSGRHDSLSDIEGRLKEARWLLSSLAERKGILALQTEKQKGCRRNPRERCFTKRWVGTDTLSLRPGG
jgi:hypothetical protein